MLNFNTISFWRQSQINIERFFSYRRFQSKFRQKLDANTIYIICSNLSTQKTTEILCLNRSGTLFFCAFNFHVHSLDDQTRYIAVIDVEFMFIGNGFFWLIYFWYKACRMFWLTCVSTDWNSCWSDYSKVIENTFVLYKEISSKRFLLVTEINYINLKITLEI